MAYQETLTTQNNKAKRILELCKSLGIEIYDSYNQKSIKSSGSNTQTVNDYLVEYYQWANLTRSHLETLFITPRIRIEFDKKDVFGTTFRLNIQAHIDNVLAQQLYFIELIINEIKNYKYIDHNAPAEHRNILKRVFVGTARTKDD